MIYYFNIFQIFNNARYVLNKKSIDIIGGFSLIKDKERKGKSVELKKLEENVKNSTDVATRQVAIEDYLMRKIRDVIVTRTIQWNVGETARTISNTIPDEFKTRISTYISEGIFNIIDEIYLKIS